MLKSMINPDISGLKRSVSSPDVSGGKKKRILTKGITLVLGLSLFFSSLVFAGPNEYAGIRFDLNATTYGNQNDTTMVSPAVGDYIRVDVYAINVHNLDTYEFEVNYNSSQLDYITATPTNPITYEPNILTTNGGTALGWMIDTSTPGVLSIAYTLAGTDTLEAPEGEGLVADIVFQTLTTTQGLLTFGDVHFYDSFGVMDIITDKGFALLFDDYGNVDGTVTDSNTGEPIEGAIVTIENTSDITGSDGTYLIEYIPIGIYDITCTAEGYYDTTDVVEVLEDQTVAVDFVLEPISSLNGTVTVANTGQPIEGALITATSQGKVEYTGSTNSEGYYIIDSLLASELVGNYTVTCDAGQHYYLGEETDVIIFGDTTTVDFVLEPIPFVDDEWSLMSTPTTAHLLSVWGSSCSDVFAVGYGGVILHYDGTNWTQMSSPTGGLDVWGSSCNDVFVASGSILHYDGTNWTQMPGPTGMHGVWGTSSSDVFAVGNSGTIFHYDGTNWTQMSTPSTENLKDIWGSSGSDVFAIGNGEVILHYDGINWTEMSTPSTQYLLDIWGSSGSDVFVTTCPGGVLHYNGTNWIPMWGAPTFISPGIWGTSGSNVFVVQNAGGIFHYDGINWEMIARPTPYALEGIWGSSGRDIFAVGDEGTIAHYGPDTITVSVSYTTYGVPSDTITVPMISEDLTGLGIIAAEFNLTYDSDILTGIDVDTSGTLLSGTDWTWQFNVAGDSVHVDMAGTDELVGSGTLINLLFVVSPTAPPGEESPLHFVDFIFNQGTPWTVNTQDGVFIVTSVGIEETPPQVPRVFALGQNYPNPFEPQTTISYTLPKSCKVCISIYNIKGQLVETLVNDVQQPGHHSVIWNAEDVSPGIYLYRITAGDFTDTKKCVILR